MDLHSNKRSKTILIAEDEALLRFPIVAAFKTRDGQFLMLKTPIGPWT